MPALNARDLTDLQWAILNDLIPEPPRRDDKRGRPWRSRRSVLNGILWVLRTGAPWADLPERYPSYQTCHRRFQQWVRSGIMRGVLEALAEDLQIRGWLDVREAFIDGSFAPAKKGERRSAKPNVARVRRLWRWQIAMVFRWPYPLKAQLHTKEVGRVHPCADGDPRPSSESHRRQRIRLRQIRRQTQALRDRTDLPSPQQPQK